MKPFTLLHGKAGTHGLTASTSHKVLGTDRPHVLRPAIECCGNFGTFSIVGLYGDSLTEAQDRHG
ncbi:hypothetical protein EV128_14029 [Rhizobium azibense]|nr:hypothetical protein EV128_14029 [Rhizobium azibense]